MKQILLFALHFLFAWVFAVMPLAARAGGEEGLADSFFSQGKFEEALAVWYGMVEAGQYNAGLYYNIGLAESQLKHVPEAMLAFEQARRLAPTDRAVMSAITDARKKIENGTIPVDAFFLNVWYRGILTFFRPGMWALMGLGFLAGGLFVFFRTSTPMPVKDQLNERSGVYFAIIGLLVVMLGFLSYRELYRDDEGIVFVYCEMHLAPAADSPKVRMISPGEKILVTDVIGEWSNVQLLNLDQGWIKGSAIKPIRIGSR